MPQHMTILCACGSARKAPLQAETCDRRRDCGCSLTPGVGPAPPFDAQPVMFPTASRAAWQRLAAEAQARRRRLFARRRNRGP